MTCTENSKPVPYYCRNCFGSGWDEGNGSCNDCRQKHDGSLVSILPRGLPGGGDIEKIEFTRETRPDGTIIERAVVYFRNSQIDTVNQVAPRGFIEEV
jgi:hypothetical protein